ncbi:hypothetical protein MKW94_026796 [Papaver nudicaule]|uniref:Uncharacterized protein n=1 Tax=Papaver nudicaule TaxID=74823 RepID=A0AA41RT94_PAPNU|nr:hypothetical protein [Papaver nudicaule]
MSSTLSTSVIIIKLFSKRNQSDDGMEGETEEAVEGQEGINDGREREQVDMPESFTTLLDSYSTKKHSETEKDGNSSDAAVIEELRIAEYERTVEEFKKNIPNLRDWQKGYRYYLNIFGYHKNKTKLGGYGVILRDPYGRPVIASSSVHSRGKADLYHVLGGKTNMYHVLEGVNAALSLAIEHGIYDLRVHFNSELLYYRLRWIFSAADRGDNSCCRANPKCDRGDCEICLRLYMGAKEGHFKSLYPLLVEILQKRSVIEAKTEYFFFDSIYRLDNKAAKSLAKEHAKEINKMQWTSREYVEKVDIEPWDFSDELKMILWEDCFDGGVTMYSDQLVDQMYWAARTSSTPHL